MCSQMLNTMGFYQENRHGSVSFCQPQLVLNDMASPYTYIDAVGQGLTPKALEAYLYILFDQLIRLSNSVRVLRA